MTLGISQRELLQHISGFVERADALFDALDRDDPLIDEDSPISPQDALDTFALEVAEERYLRMVLCTGGPHVEVLAQIDNDGHPHGHRVRAFWGGATYERPINNDSVLARALDNYADLMML